MDDYFDLGGLIIHPFPLIGRLHRIQQALTSHISWQLLNAAAFFSAAYLETLLPSRASPPHPLSGPLQPHFIKRQLIKYYLLCALIPRLSSLRLGSVGKSSALARGFQLLNVTPLAFKFWRKLSLFNMVQIFSVCSLKQNVQVFDACSDYCAPR